VIETSAPASPTSKVGDRRGGLLRPQRRPRKERAAGHSIVKIPEIWISIAPAGIIIIYGTALHALRIAPARSRAKRAVLGAAAAPGFRMRTRQTDWGEVIACASSERSLSSPKSMAQSLA